MAGQKFPSDGKDIPTDFDQPENMEHEISPSKRDLEPGFEETLEKSLPTFLLENMHSKTVDEKVEKLEENCKRRKEIAKQSMEEINKKYDKVSNDFKRKIKEIQEVEVKKLKSVIETCDSTLEELKELKSTVASVCEKEDEQSIIQSKIDKMVENVQNAAAKGSITGFEIVEAADDPETDIKETIYHIRRARPYLIKTLNISLPGQIECSISSILPLGDDLVLVVDYPHYYLKLINTRTNTIVSSDRVKHTGMPWAMCEKDNGHVYVSLIGAKEMLHLTYPRVRVSAYYLTPLKHEVYGVHYYKHHGTFKMQCFNPSKVIQTYDNGKMLRIIHEDITKEENKEGKPYIQTPIHSCINIKTGNVISCCQTMGSISEIKDDCCNPTEVVCWVHDQQTLQEPSGLVMDDDGSLLVCSKRRGMIFRVKRSGEITPYIQVYQDAFFRLEAVAIDRKNRNLYVGGRHNEVLVYQM